MVGSGLGRGAQLAEGGLAPVGVVAVAPAILPGRIVADARDADKEIDVTHQLGEEQRGEGARRIGLSSTIFIKLE